MKTKFIFLVVIAATLFASCKKSGSSTPTLTYLISQDSATDGVNMNNNLIRHFAYNSSKKLVKVSYEYGTSGNFNQYDTVYYNGNGTVSKVERYNGSLYATNLYNYTSGLLTSVNESGTNDSGAYVRNRAYTYSGNKLASQSLVYSVGVSDQNGPENIDSIVYSGNNFSTAYLQDMSTGVTLTFDVTAPNPYYGLNFDSNDFLDMFNPNNITEAYATATPSTIFLHDTYTYSSGRVATITDLTQSPSYVTTISYVGL
jgi:hypothetical protein